MNEPRPLPGVQVLPPMPERVREPGPNAPPPVERRTRRSNGTPATRGRFASINAFVDRIAAGLTRSQLATWLVLWRDTDAGTGLARTAAADIARRTGASRRAVGDAIRQLCEQGLLVRVRRGGLNLGPSVYRVTAEHRRKRPAGGSRDIEHGKPASH